MNETLIQTQETGLGILSARPFGWGVLVGFYYVSPIYAVLCHLQRATQPYDDRYMELQERSFRNEQMASMRKL